MTLAQNWFTKNSSDLNMKKRHFVKFLHGTKKPASRLLINCHSESIPQISTVNFLGVEISETCKWNIQIDTKCKRLSSISSCIYQLKLLVGKSKLISYIASFYNVLRHIFLKCVRKSIEKFLNAEENNKNKWSC